MQHATALAGPLGPPVGRSRDRYLGVRGYEWSPGRTDARNGFYARDFGRPDSTPSVRTATASRAELVPEDVDPTTGRLTDGAIGGICLQLETVRSQSHAVRNLNLVSNLRHAIEQIGGTVMGVDLNNAVYVRLADGKDIVVYPTVGVPTSTTLHDATTNPPDQSVAVIYDPVGLHKTWLGHLDWHPVNGL